MSIKRLFCLAGVILCLGLAAGLAAVATVGAQSSSDPAQPTEEPPPGEPPHVTEEPLPVEPPPPVEEAPPVAPALQPQQAAEPVVSLTVTSATYEEAHTWDIEKYVDRTAHTGLPGDLLEWGWTVRLNESWVEQNYAVTGEFSVTNPGPAPITLYIWNRLNDYTPGIVSSCAGGEWDSDNWLLTVPAGGAATCGYTAHPTSLEASQVILSAGDYTATVDFTFAKIVLNGSAIVTDEQTPALAGGVTVEAGGGSWVWTQPQSHVCSTDPAGYGAEGSYSSTISNTATVSGSDGQIDTASASTTYTCYQALAVPDISVTASHYFERIWNWDLSKEESGFYSLYAGQSVSHTFTITVTSGGYDDYNDGVKGTITIANPRDTEAMTLDSVTLIAHSTDPQTSVEAVVDCGGSLVIPAGGSLTCTYDTGPIGSYVTLGPAVTATVVVLGENALHYHYVSEWITFSTTPAVEIDPVVTVDDTQVEGENWTADRADGTWSYETVFACPTDRKLYTNRFYSNLYWNDVYLYSDGNQLDWVSRVVSLECAQNCTLAADYWKTHSSYGPAAYDDAWAQVGEDAPFFLSAQTYYQVMQQAARGNAYYILAQQYIAAQLNFVRADPAAAQAAFDQATLLFNAYTPADIAALKGSDDVRKTFIALAETLSAYNRGALGPGACKGKR